MNRQRIWRFAWRKAVIVEAILENNLIGIVALFVWIVVAILARGIWENHRIIREIDDGCH